MALVPRRVTWAYRSTTTEWVCLRWSRGTAREGITTPGHHFLDAFGPLPATPDLTRTGSAVVPAFPDGSLGCAPLIAA